MLRPAVVAISLVQTLLWLLIVHNSIVSIELATRGLHQALATAASVVFALSGAPALTLGLVHRHLKLALIPTSLPVVAALAGALWWLL